MNETQSVMRLAIPAQPPTLNQLMRGTLRQRMQRERNWKLLVSHAATQAGIPKAIRKRWVTLTIILGPRQRGADVDAFWKSTLDALRACGAIRDDSRKWVGLFPVQYESGPAPACHIDLLEDER